MKLHDVDALEDLLDGLSLDFLEDRRDQLCGKGQALVFKVLGLFLLVGEFRGWRLG